MTHCRNHSYYEVDCGDCRRVRREAEASNDTSSSLFTNPFSSYSPAPDYSSSTPDTSSSSSNDSFSGGGGGFDGGGASGSF